MADMYSSVMEMNKDAPPFALPYPLWWISYNYRLENKELPQVMIS